MSTIETGTRGEDIAVKFLQKFDYKVIERNFRTRFGEIDIIAWHTKPHFGNTLCFVEVKTRNKNDGSAERATDWKKQRRIQTAAKSYCQQNKINIDETPIQFEQVSVYTNKSIFKKPDIQLFTIIPETH